MEMKGDIIGRTLIKGNEGDIIGRILIKGNERGYNRQNLNQRK